MTRSIAEMIGEALLGVVSNGGRHGSDSEAWAYRHEQGDRRHRHHEEQNLRQCARVLKPGGRLVLVDSLQRGDEPDYEWLLELFPQNYHEPYYASYTTEDFDAIARACGLTHIRDVKAFVSKVMVFNKSETS
jgi:SAM-dependent methyltransferase